MTTTTTPQINIERLKQIGSEWTSGDRHRIYFNYPAQYIDGISDTKARKINTYCKVFYDITTGKFMHQGLSEESAKSIFQALTNLAS